MANLQVSTVPKASHMAARSLMVSVLAVGAIFLVLGPRTWGYLAATLAAAHPHAPRMELIAGAPAVIQIHLYTVLAAFALATLQVVGPKGARLHRILGWTLAALFVTTAVDSFFIRNPQSGPFNPFQLFSVWTLIGIPLGVIAARRHKVAFHGRMMMGFYIGSLVIAGALTFMPGRLMWRVFFG